MIRAALQQRGLWPKWQRTGKPYAHQHHERPRVDDDEAIEQAERLWGRAVPIRGTAAETYLREIRGITIPLPGDHLRFLQWAHAGFRVPALVAAVRIPTGRLTGVQLTYLDRETCGKLDCTYPRKTFGSLRNGAVRLVDPPDEYLALAEGLETALSVAQRYYVPCWAACGIGQLGNVALPDSVTRLEIFADNDEPGKRAAKVAASNFLNRNRRLHVEIVVPRGHKDFNDVLMAEVRS